MYVSFYELNLELQAKDAEYSSRILLYVSAYCYMCPHTRSTRAAYCYMCPQTAVCVRIRGVREPHTALYVLGYIVSGERRGVRESRILLCVRILICMCAHTAIYVSACCYICVRILQYI